MKIIFVFGLIVIGISIILLSISAWWIWKLDKPTIGKDCKTNSDWLWDKSCLFFQEKFLDPSLTSPSKLSPYLTKFTFAQGGGASINLPCWYRFRYVNVKTGGYSDFSEWTKTPVISGSCCLPCPKAPGNCPSTIKNGYDSCSFNQPTIGVSFKDAQYNPTRPQLDGSFVYMNLHRYVGQKYTDSEPPPPDAKDQIVGYLKPGGYIDGIQYYDWTDVLFNPCDKGCEIPSWCKGSNKPCTGSCIET